MKSVLVAGSDAPTRRAEVAKALVAFSAGVDPLDIDDFDLSDRSQVGAALAAITIPPMLSAHRVVVWRGAKALEGSAAKNTQLVALLQDACARATDRLAVIVERETETPRKKGDPADPATMTWAESSVAGLLSGATVVRCHVPAPWQADERTARARRLAEAFGLSLPTAAVEELRSRVGDDADALLSAFKALSAAKPDGQHSAADVRRHVPANHADPVAFVEAVLRGEVSLAMQLAKQFEAAGADRASTAFAIQRIVWERYVVRLSKSEPEASVAAALRLSSGAVFLKRKGSRESPAALRTALEACVDLAQQTDRGLPLEAMLCAFAARSTRSLRRSA